MAKIDDAIAIIQSSFTTNWTSRLSNLVTVDDINDNPSIVQLELNFALFLNPVINDFYQCLNFSILEGEYVSDIDNFKLKLESLDTLLRNIAANLDIPGFPNMSIVAQQYFQSYFYIAIEQSIKKFKSLLYVAEKHLIYEPNTSTILYVLTNESDHRNIQGIAKEHTKIFDLNFQLAKIDHSLSFKEEFFRALLLLKDTATRINPSPVIEIILKKCDFLLYKISFRLKQSRKNFIYAIDFNFSSVQLNEVADFSLYNDIIKSHYDEGIVPPQSFELRRKNALERFDRNIPLTFDDFHALTKYFKDVTKDLPKLQKLRQKYTVFYNANNQAPSKFDEKAFNLNFCYIDNNILSLELDKNILDIQNWKHKLQDCTNQADQYKNKNFFAYFKIIKEFLSKEISKQFFERAFDFKVLQSLINEYKKHLEILIENVGICEEIDYLAFQNPYSLCLTQIVDSTNTPRICFISSSFVLPINYKQFKEKLEQYKAELNKFNSMLDVQKMIDQDRKDIHTVKQEIAKTDKRHIEILSIFAALVMFVSNEIQIFTKIPNMADAVIYTLFFSFGLGFFVLLIWFITRPEGVKFKDLRITHIVISIFFIIGLVGAFIYVIKAKPSYSNQNKLQDLEFRIDSMKKQKVIDSLTIQNQTDKPVKSTK